MHLVNAALYCSTVHSLLCSLFTHDAKSAVDQCYYVTSTSILVLVVVIVKVNLVALSNVISKLL